MKIKSNGMVYDENHKSMDKGFKYNGSLNNKSGFTRVYVIKKRNQSAGNFSDLILKEFQGTKALQDYSNSIDLEKSVSTYVNKDEINALKILNEYWA